MKYRAECTYCTSQVMNTYPNMRKNPMLKDELHTYIAVDTEEEKTYIESINDHMKMALTQLQGLVNYIETKKP